MTEGVGWDGKSFRLGGGGGGVGCGKVNVYIYRYRNTSSSARSTVDRGRVSAMASDDRYMGLGDRDIWEQELNVCQKGLSPDLRSMRCHVTRHSVITTQ